MARQDYVGDIMINAVYVAKQNVAREVDGIMGKNNLSDEGLGAGPQWYWCRLCLCLSTRCNYCNGTLCNGMTCVYCLEQQLAAERAIADGTAPRPQDVPHTYEECKALFDKPLFGESVDQYQKRKQAYEEAVASGDIMEDKSEWGHDSPRPDERG